LELAAAAFFPAIVLGIFYKKNWNKEGSNRQVLFSLDKSYVVLLWPNLSWAGWEKFPISRKFGFGSGIIT